MSRVYLDITGRFGAAFGTAARNFIPRATEYNPYGFSQYELEEEDFEDIKFTYGSAGARTEINFASTPFRQSVKGKFHIPFTTNIGTLKNVVAPPPLVQFTSDKKHIITGLNDQVNQVVERWNTQPWSIRMRGLLIDMSEHKHPSKLKRIVRRLFEYNNVVDVSGGQFEDQNIAHVYFTNITIQGVQGYQDTIQYTLMAKSARQANFTLLNPN